MKKPTIPNPNNPVSMAPILEVTSATITKGDWLLFIIGIVFGLCVYKEQ